MLVTKMVSIPDQEITVEIDGNDIVSGMLGDTEGWRPEQLIRRAFNNIGGFMQKIPDADIGKLSPELRQMIAIFCRTQAERFEKERL